MRFLTKEEWERRALVGKRIEILRTHRRMSAYRLALLSGIEKGQVRLIETRGLGLSIETAHKLSKAMGITLPTLLKGIYR